MGDQSQSQYWQQQPGGGWSPQQPPGYPPQQPQLPGWAPGGQTPPAGGTETAPPAPKPPTPLDPPVVYYNKTWSVPPLVVDTQEQADALDPNEWTSNVAAAPATSGAQADKPQWPQLYYNVNVSPKIVNDAAEAKSLGEGWKQFALPDALCKAAEAANAQAKAKQDAAAQKQAPA